MALRGRGAAHQAMRDDPLLSTRAVELGMNDCDNNAHRTWTASMDVQHIHRLLGNWLSYHVTVPCIIRCHTCHAPLCHERVQQCLDIVIRKVFAASKQLEIPGGHISGEKLKDVDGAGPVAGPVALLYGLGLPMKEVEQVEAV